MVKRIHGRHGEMLIMPFTEREERFAAGSQLYLSHKREQDRHRVTVAASRPSERGPLIRLEGYDSREKAQELFGASLFIMGGELAEPAADTYYPFQLEGCEVWSGADLVGTVTALGEAPRANPWLEIDPGEDRQHVLIPFVSSVVLSIDLERCRIEIVPDFLGQV